MQNQNRTCLRVYLAVLIVSVFASRIIMLNKSPWPNGLDGAYYAMEFRSFMERGHLENPDLSPIFRIGGIISRISGNPVEAVKICSALLSALLVGGSYFLIRAIKPESPGRATAAAILTAVSPSLTKMSLNYLNNLGGLAFCLFFLSFASLYIRTRKWKYLPLALLFFLSAVLSHRVSALYLFAVITCYGCASLWQSKQKKTQISISIVFSLLLLIMLFFFKIEDYQRFKNSFSISPLLPIFSSIFRKQLPIAISIEISIYFFLSYLLVFRIFLRRKKWKWVYSLVPLFFFPFWNLRNFDMGYRMLLSSIPAGVYYTATAPFPCYQRDSRWKYLILFLILPLVFITTLIYNPLQDPPYGRYHQIVEYVNLDDDSLLIAHQGLNHIYTYDKNFRDALNYVPDFPVSDNKVWRLAYRAPYKTISSLFPLQSARGEIRALPYNYILIREELWQKYLAWEDEDLVESLKSWFNPYKKRPDFIR